MYFALVIVYVVSFLYSLKIPQLINKYSQNSIVFFNIDKCIIP